MNNEEAMVALETQRDAINSAINELNRYRREGDNWKSSVKATRVAEVMVLSSRGGVDLSSWDGTPAPPPPDDETIGDRG